MGMQMDFSGISNPDDLQSGGNRPKAGRGMAMISKFDEYGGKGGAHEMELEIIAWSDKDSETLTHTVRIPTKDNTGKGHPQKVMAALGIAGGLFMPPDIAAWNEAGEAPEIDFTLLEGRPIMVQFVEEPKKDANDKPIPGESWLNVGSFGKAFFHIMDPRVKDWPVNQGIYNSNAAKVGEYRPVGEPAAKESAKADQPAQPDNPFANA